MKVCDNCFNGAQRSVEGVAIRMDFCQKCFDAFKTRDWETLQERKVPSISLKKSKK